MIESPKFPSDDLNFKVEASYNCKLSFGNEN